jgi:hypothetical protein
MWSLSAVESACCVFTALSSGFKNIDSIFEKSLFNICIPFEQLAVAFL